MFTRKIIPSANHRGENFFQQEIEPALKKSLEELKSKALSLDDSAAVKKASGKLQDLNRTTLQDSIARMIEGYEVPLIGMEKSFLIDLIKLRNDIVHHGVARSRFQPELKRQVPVIRELLTRIFLKLLNYNGRYQSYLTGHEQFVVFPPS